MAKSRIITRNVGDLRGFSTDSIYLRPANVADKALNIQKAPDGTMQLRRGYQAQVARIGGLGLGTFDDPEDQEIKTVTIGFDGFAYTKLTKQLFLYYNGRVTGSITGLTNANPGVATSPAHGLQTGASVILRDVGGMTTVNNIDYTITVIDPNNFSIGIDTSDTTLFPPYTSGGTWSIAFADQRYLTFSIYTDPLYIYNNAMQSITCKIIVNRAAQKTTTQTGTVFTVEFGHELAIGDVVQFLSSAGVQQERTITAAGATSITVSGSSVTVAAGTYFNQYFNLVFGKGFDTTSTYTIAQFIAAITDPVSGVYGLTTSINGDTNLPAAFLQIVEPKIITSSKQFTMDYWYWGRINSTVNPPLPGSASAAYQRAPDFENASMAAYDDVIYVANGIDYPQKYDGQTIYRAGMPVGVRPRNTDNTTYLAQPFVTGNAFEYMATYEQIDNRGHIVEGERSEVNPYTVVAANAAINVSVTNLLSTAGENWNTNSAVSTGVVTAGYGPDSDGFYYDLVTVTPGYTLQVGDTAYYADRTCAVISAGAGPVLTIPVNAGHGVLAGDTISFIDSSETAIQRLVASVTATSVTITGSEVTVLSDATHQNITNYLTSKVFANVAIVDVDQIDVTTITVNTGFTVQSGDVVGFIDASGDTQRRTVTAVAVGSLTIDGIAVSVSALTLISSETQRANAITLQRLNPNAAGMDAGDAISNNLRINIYRTEQGSSFGVNGKLFLVASIPNNPNSATTTYIDAFDDAELGREYSDPDRAPNPPPICKYVKAFGNQLFYAGGERNNPENSDRIFFSEGNFPETVPLARNAFNVPNVDDDVTGIGVSGSTVVVTKNHSLWAATGNFLSGQIEVVQIAPGTNIGCAAHASIASVGSLMYFLHTNGVYSITENQLFPTDPFGNPVPISLMIDAIFRETTFLPQYRYVFKRAVAINYTKDNQYLLFLPCEDANSSARTANSNSALLCYDYEGKNWFQWTNMNAAGGMVVIDDDLFFQERRFSGVNGNVANLYKQHRFYRLVDHADHAGPQRCEWTSSWEDLGQPEVRKKFSKCILLLDRLSEIQQFNNPEISFYSCLNRLPNLKNTLADISQTDNVRNSSWGSSWSWNTWSGYQDSFVTVNLKQGTVAKSMQVGFTIVGIDMDIRLAGYQLEAIPENRMTVVR